MRIPPKTTKKVAFSRTPVPKAVRVSEWIQSDRSARRPGLLAFLAGVTQLVAEQALPLRAARRAAALVEEGVSADGEYQRPILPSLVLSFMMALTACGPALASPSEAVPTPSENIDPAASATAPGFGAPAAGCSIPSALTPAMTEGPYYRAGSPERTSLLEAGTAGTRLVLRGSVLASDCRPVAGAWLDFWQADAAGRYDNQGYSLRGHQYADEAGRFELTTVVPGIYTGRTEHIHVKVQAPGGPVLTTQLFFPGVPENQTDSIFDPALVVRIMDETAGLTAAFDFVVETR